MCKILKVSSSGYYYWLKSPLSKREHQQKELQGEIRRIYEKSKGRYGSPRIREELIVEGLRVSRPRVARHMKSMGLKSIIRKQYRVQTTDSDHYYPVAENHLNRDFQAGKLAQKWVSDLTYIRTDEGWLYLTGVLDLADRKIVGWALSESMKAKDTSIAAWKMALKNRPVTAPLLFHSDRGVQYACNEFREQFRGFPVTQSMSRKGNCWDNAVAESFFKTMKTEMVYHRKFKSKAEAKLAIFEYIEVWYNRKRRHSALGYLSPCQYEEVLTNGRMSA